MKVRLSRPRLRLAHVKKTMGCTKTQGHCSDNRLAVVTLNGMCRNIRTLHNFEPPASEEEIRASALQYVRKVSGSTKPSKANEEAFKRALDEVTASRDAARLARDERAAEGPRGRGRKAPRARREALRGRLSRAPRRWIRVLEFSPLIAGPFCGLKLRDLGADVVKVEPPAATRAGACGRSRRAARACCSTR